MSSLKTNSFPASSASVFVATSCVFLLIYLLFVDIIVNMSHARNHLLYDILRQITGSGFFGLTFFQRKSKNHMGA